MLNLNEFWHIGREQRFAQRNPLQRAFTWLFGPLGLHSRIRAGHVIRAIRPLGLPPDAWVLDAGSGNGLVLFWLAAHYPAYHLHGIDCDPALVARAQGLAAASRRPALTFEQGNLATLEAVGGPYDLIFSIDVLEHIADDVRVLGVLRQALKPRGVLVLHLPLRHQEQRRIFAAFKAHTIAEHVRDEYTPAELQSKLEAAGFRLDSLQYGFGWQGELAFELNNLFWSVPLARAVSAVLTYPVAGWLAYRDVNAQLASGNSLIALARPQASS